MTAGATGATGHLRQQLVEAISAAQEVWEAQGHWGCAPAALVAANLEPVLAAARVAMANQLAEAIEAHMHDRDTCPVDDSCGVCEGLRIGSMVALGFGGG